MPHLVITLQHCVMVRITDSNLHYMKFTRFTSWALRTRSLDRIRSTLKLITDPCCSRSSANCVRVYKRKISTVIEILGFSLETQYIHLYVFCRCVLSIDACVFFAGWTTRYPLAFFRWGALIFSICAWDQSESRSLKDILDIWHTKICLKSSLKWLIVNQVKFFMEMASSWADPPILYPFLREVAYLDIGLVSWTVFL